MSMQALISASQSMLKMQTMQSARTQMQGSVNVLKIESKRDGGNEKKDAKALELEDASNDLMNALMSEANDVNETLQPDEELTAEKEEETEQEKLAEAQKSKTDTVDISQSASKHLEGTAHAKSVVQADVIYHPDGSTTPSAGIQNTPIFQAIA